MTKKIKKIIKFILVGKLYIVLTVYSFWFINLFGNSLCRMGSSSSSSVSYSDKAAGQMVAIYSGGAGVVLAAVMFAMRNQRQ
jgi:hypothetical protein